MSDHFAGLYEMTASMYVTLIYLTDDDNDDDLVVEICSM
jgi:hypothetical protein